MLPSSFTILLLATIAVSDDIRSPKHLGCWADELHDRAIAGGIRSESNNPVEECRKYAENQGFSVFAVQDNKECFTAADAEKTYKKHGMSNVCYNGRGGFKAQNVYLVNGQGNLVNKTAY